MISVIAEPGIAAATRTASSMLAVLAWGVLGGCSGPSGPHAWLAPGSMVPAAEDDPVVAATIDERDGVPRVVPLVHGFAEGSPIAYWDFERVDTAGTMPLYRLCRRVSATTCTPVEHPYVVDALPGDDGYSHFGRLYEVEVSGTWAGEIMPSREAIDDAVRDGLAVAPVRTDRYLHCPIVHREVRVEVRDGATLGPVPVYVRGTEARCVDFSATHGPRELADDRTGSISVRNVYVVFREGDELPIHEAIRDEDLTGDGDRADTNNILGVAFANASYTPLWQPVTVTVPATYASIDTARDQTMADYRAASDMFTIDADDYEIHPIAGRVVAHEETGVLVDCPIQSAPGML
jgi:hypothetical protein